MQPVTHFVYAATWCVVRGLDFVCLCVGGHGLFGVLVRAIETDRLGEQMCRAVGVVLASWFAY